MELLNLHIARLSEAREENKVMLTQEVQEGNDPEARINMAMMENEIDEATYKASIDPEIHVTDAKKTQHNKAWRTYRERTSRPEKYQGQVLSIFMGQCMQVLLEK